jgi:hypothetical protein
MGRKERKAWGRRATCREDPVQVKSGVPPSLGTAPTEAKTTLKLGHRGILERHLYRDGGSTTTQRPTLVPLAAQRVRRQCVNEGPTHQHLFTGRCFVPNL